jgi:4-hydroxy-3-methylbut-2-en-1-yl diphosphate reductase
VPVERVLLAEPRGFCAGVEKAIKALGWMVAIFEPPVYCYHEIVHNQRVVEAFRDLGVIFVDDVADVPEGAPLMLSAHGTSPYVAEAARSQSGVVVDAVCPLVTKVHHELKTRSRKGYTILYVGHAGHEEAVGTMAVAPEAVRLIETEEDVAALEDFDAARAPVALLAQTTLSHDEWDGLREAAQRRFPELWLPGRSDLCFATTNRQQALRAIAGHCDAMVVIGSANSSNTLALERTARAANCPRVLRVNRASELPDDLAGVVGVIAGASAPESLVDEVLERLAPAHGTEEVHAVPEDEYFPLPRELREVLRSVAGLLAVAGFAPLNAGGGEPLDKLALDGRHLPAAKVLATLG